jgi:hypothetical protein
MQLIGDLITRRVYAELWQPHQSSNTIAALMAVLFRMLSSASPNCSSLNTLLTMPFVLILPESRYSTV